MFFRAKRAVARAWFNWNAQALLRNPPLSCSDPSLTLVTMLCHGETVMYLLAVTSFCQQLGRVPRIVILDDGSLTADDREKLTRHLPGVRILRFQDVPAAACPKKNCWERLLLISDLVADSYVVQLDSDTLTLGPIDQVVSCIEENLSFTLLGDGSYPGIETLGAACERYGSNQSSMVQGICERSFNQLAERQSLFYVRGNAGFTGFARGSFDRSRVVFFSDLMRGIASGTWDQWGSEQVASNLIVANTPGAQILPFPRYLSHWAHPDVNYEKASFIHFIGPHRFANGLYVRSSRRALAGLKASS
jgi:hypothetical protein